MRSTLVALLVLSVLGALPASAGESRDKAEAAFFKALYLEQGKRDLKKAEAAYSDFLWEYETEPDLAVRAMLGLARIGAQTGTKNAGPNIAEVGKIIADMKARGEIPKELLPAIEKELAKAQELVEFTSRFPEVTNQLGILAREFFLGPKHKSAQNSIEALVPFGDQAVPAMSKALEEKNPLVVACAAQVLVRIRSEAGSAALVRALEDPAALYPAQVAGQLSYAEPYHAKVFEAGLKHDLASVRLTVLESLVGVAASRFSTYRLDPILQGVMFKVLDDPDPAVRRAALKADWSDALAVPALLRGFRDDEPANRALAVGLLQQGQLTRGTVQLPPESSAPLLGLLDHDDRGVRFSAFQLLRRMQGDAIQQAFTKALRSGNRELQQHVVGSLRDVPRTNEVQEALLFAARECLAGPTTVSQARWFVTLANHIFDNSVRWDPQGLLPLLTQMHRWPLRFDINPWSAPFDTLVSKLKALPQQRIPADFVRRGCEALQLDRHKATWVRTFMRSLGEERFEFSRMEIGAKSGFLRALAAEILLEPGCPHGTLLDRSLLEDPDSGVRLSAARALIRRERGKFLEELLEFVAQNPDLAGEITKEVVETLDQPLSYTFVQRTLNLLHKADATYRRAVWLAAPDLPDEAMVLNAIRNPVLVIVVAPIAVKRRITAAWPVLIESSAPAALKAVEEFEKYFAAKKAYESLKVAVAGEEDPVILKVRALAKSEDPQLRAAACHALAMLGDRAAVSMLLDLVQDGEDSVRKAALLALAQMGGMTRPAEDK